MKKFLALVLLLLVFCSSYALGDGDTTGTQTVNLPAEISTFLSTGRWKDWTVTGWANPRDLQVEGACAFAVVKDGSKNDLLAFGWRGGKWVYLWHNDSALPQVEEPVILVSHNDDYERYCFTSLFVYNGEIDEDKCLWVMQKNGTWRLEEMYCYNQLMFFDLSNENAVHLYNTGWTSEDIEAWVYGVYVSDLRYFNFAGFPKTVKEAREQLTNPPKIPTGELTAESIKFAKMEQYPVYSAPGETALRGANGKAVVSTNDWIQVFGEENGYILIQYALDKDHMRFGYIAANALPNGKTVKQLAFAPRTAYLAQDASLTDDPLYSQRQLIQVAKGESVVLLATMGEWAYVEVNYGDWVRGFVKQSLLTFDNTFDLSSQSEGAAQGTLTVKADGQVVLNMTTSISPMPDAFMLTDLGGNVLCNVSKGQDGIYQGSFPLPSGITSISFVPRYENGTNGETLFRVEW